MSGLVTFYKNRLEELDDKEAIKAILKGQKVDEATVFSLLDDCQAIAIETPQDILLFYQKFLTLIFVLPYSNVESSLTYLPIKELLKKGGCEGYWKSFQLPQAFAALCAYEITGTYEKLDVRQLEKGGVLLECGSHTLDGSVVRPFESAYLALIWLYLGWANQDEELLSAGLKLAQFCMNFCDNEGIPFEGLWTRESDYHPFAYYSALALLFSMASHLRLSSKMNVMKEVLFEKLEEKAVDRIDPLTLLLALNFRKLIDEGKPYPETSPCLTLYDTDRSLGFLRYDFGSLSLACSVCGVNTGLGSIHKNRIHIGAFGPHYYPLADSECFGIYRISNGSREGFKDLMIERKEGECQFKGWSRVISPISNHVSKQNFSFAHPGTQWLFFDIRAEKECLQLDVRMDKCIQESPLSFVFFVSAEKAHVKGDHSLIPGALERYQGRSGEIIFERGDKQLVIKPQFEGEMQVIPLAGKSHFWSADFLLAFSLTEKLKLYSWKVK